MPGVDMDGQVFTLEMRPKTFFVFGALGTGVYADSFNTKPFPVEMVRLLLTRNDPLQNKRIEHVLGSIGLTEQRTSSLAI
ncbi:hypothetical protein CA13_72400 [Planctomycetes bacterium CA13]|uniref:Uncharacterized protein n=1 Tax=Novipirellula herctigrandis TaxID=2527986 RepID=A0A5C5YP69_9BACT|nr:hypothetical protein CA13_72400 [Planctomycetes bacterium CA13]